ncbi:MAG: oligoendopeptidase F [candidate division Zixibacteria bacterium]|nr:oligoendopeptidase F [candidate division Zixibacteria bacterium]
MSKRKVFSIWLVVLLFAVVTWSNTFAQSTDKKAIPQRSDISDKYKWKLEDIYPTTEDWEKDFAELEKFMPQVSTFKGQLAESGKKLLDCLTLTDKLDDKFWKLYVYANLKLDEDTRVSASQEMAGRSDDLYTRWSETISFIQPEIIEIPQDKLENFMKKEKGLDSYRFFFENIIRSKAHILSQEEEKILALSGDLSRSPGDIFAMINNADIKYPVIKDENGEEVQLTKERYLKFTESRDRRVRREANHAYNSSYLKYLNTLGMTFTSQIKKDIFYARARKFNSSLESSLNDNNIPVSVYESLIEAVNKNLKPLHKYIALRKKYLQYDTLFNYDLFVYLVPEVEVEIPYDSALDIISSALAPLGEDYVKDLNMGFNSRWIDVYETEGKRSGGYNWGSYSTNPYILLNYNNTLDNVFTVCHEMGHCLHAYYTNRSEPYVYGGHSLFAAEVGSTVNETLLMQYLLDKVKDKALKQYLLEYYINQFINTFYFQVLLAEFEKTTHEKMESGEALSAEAIRKAYREITQRYWGPELYIDSLNDMGALRVPHLYRNFYVYQYATAFAAANFLFNDIYSGNKAAIKRYKEFLMTGTSDYPINILKKCGVDMSTSEPVDITIKLFGKLVDELEKTLQE